VLGAEKIWMILARRGHQVGAKYLPIFSKDLTDQKAVFLPAFLKLGIRSFVAKNVIAECAAWYLQCFAESMDIILPTGNAPLFPGPTPGRASAILIFITQGVKCYSAEIPPLDRILVRTVQNADS
uniref:hypothetical protein n=1 Tax=Dysosmobacter welbionis TaxID=2093857 RepID=UPI00307CBDDA